MKKLLALVILGGLILQSASAVDLKQSKFTQVVNSVEIISSSTRHTAEVNDVFQMPDVLRTGPSSRAEMVADDGTITRVGANTIFSFDPAERTIDMQQGSLLFHSPHGKGGGTIRTGSATASVIGTTIIVTATPNGGFKVLDLEGEAEVRFLNGLHETLQPGQMTFILPGGTGSPIIVFRLDVLTQTSLLINGFNNPLPSWPAILNEITQQLTLLLNGLANDPGLDVGDYATPQTVQVVMNLYNENLGRHLPNTSIIGTDHTANQTLPVDYSPLDPKDTHTGPFTPPANFSEGLTFLGLSGPSSGFTGNNIDIDTANINLGPFSGDSDFDIMAPGNIKIWQSLYFSSDVIEPAVDESTSLPGTVALFAAGTMEIAPNSILEADTGTFGLVAGSFGTLDTDNGTLEAPGVLSGVDVYNDYGDVDILSQSDLAMENGSTVYAGGDVDIQSDGTLKLGGEGSISETEAPDYDFLAGGYGSVTLEGTDGLTLCDALVNSLGENEPYDTDVNLTSFNGNIKISDSELVAGRFFYDLGDEESLGGSVNIDAGGNVTMCDDSVYATAGIDSGSGEVNIYASGTGNLEDTYIDADSDVSIESVDSLTLGCCESDEIDAGGSISLLSDTGNVYVDYDLYAGGDVNITSGGSEEVSGEDETVVGGNINVEYSGVEAGYDSSTGGNVNINAYNGNVCLMYDGDGIEAYSDGNTEEGSVNVYGENNVGIEDTYIYADNTVDIESGESLTANTDESDEIEGVNGITLTSDYGDVSVNGYDLEADNGDVDISAYGDLAATCGSSGSGTINLVDTYIYAGTENSEEGSVSVTAPYGGINLNGDGIYAYSDDSLACDGKIDISAGDNILINGGTDLQADGNVDIISDGSVSESDDSSDSTAIDITGSSIYAGYDDTSSYSGGSICIKSDEGDICLNDDGLYAYSGVGSDGNIRIDSGGNAEITDDTTLEAGGSVYIDAGGSESEKSLESSSGYGDVYVNCSDIYAGVDATSGGSICVNAGGNVTIKSSDVYADDNIDINGGNSYDAGDVSIKCSTIDAGDEYDGESAYPSSDGGNVTIDSNIGNLCVYDSCLNAYEGINADGDITLYADNNISVESSYITADGSVNISGYGSLSATADVSGTPDSGMGAIDIEGSTITAGADDSTSGSVCITAPNGGINLYSDDLYAYNDGSLSCDGKIYISAGDNIIIGGDSQLYADGNVDIKAYGDCTAVDISCSDIYAGSEGDFSSPSYSGGSLSIAAEDGNICLSDDGLYANAGYDSCGNIKLFADGNVTVKDDTTLQANGSVYITSGGTESLPSIESSSGYGDTYVDCSDIYAGYGDTEGGEICVNAGGNVTIKSSHVYAYDDIDINAGLGVNVDEEDSTTPGSVDINCSYLYAGYDASCGYPSADGGNLTINAYGGDVHLSDSDLVAYANDESENGFINITANDNIDAYCSSLTADGDTGYQVTLDADNGYVKVYDSYESSDLCISDWSITAGTCVSLSADDFMGVYGSSITAQDGDVSITSSDSDVDIEEGTTITADGTIYAMANDGNVCIGDYSDLQAEGDASICATGNINVKDYSAIVTDGSISLNAEGNITVCDSYLSASEGNTIAITGDSEPPTSYSTVCLSSDGDLTVDGEDGSFTTTGYDIGADHTIYLSGNDGVTIDDAVIETLNEDDSCEKIDVSSDGNICINESTLTGDGSISVISDGGNITIGDGSIISAQGGDVTIGSACQTDNIKLSCDDICSADDVSIQAGGSVKVMDSTIKAYDGDVDIAADAMDDLNGGMLTIDSDNSSLEVTKDVLGEDTTFDICASDDVDLSGDCVSVKETAINAGDAISIASNDGDVTLSAVDLVTSSGGIYLSADEGDLTLESGCDDYGVNICAGACVDACATGNICISDATIVADMSGNGGSVKVAAGRNLYISGDSYLQGDSVKLTAYGNVSLDSVGVSSEGTEAGSDNVIITSGDGVDNPDEYIPSSSASEVPAYIGFTSTSISPDATYNTGSYPPQGSGTLIELIGDGDTEAYSDSVGVEGSLGVMIQDVTYVSGTDGNIGSGDTQIIADSGDVTIQDSATLQSEDGNVYITADNSDNQDVMVCDSGLEADGGDVQINAGGNVTIGDSFINASQDVSLDSEDGMLSIDEDRTSFSGNFSTGVDIYAQGVIQLSGNCVSITDAALYAQNDNFYDSGEDGIAINSYDGNIELQGAYLAAYQGDINMYASSGSLNLSEEGSESANFIQAGGSVVLGADDMVNVSYADIYAGCDIDVSGFDCTGVSDSYLEAGGNVCIASVGDVTLSDDGSFCGYGIYSDGGDVNVNSFDGNVNIGDTTIQAYGNVNIGADDTIDVLGDETIGDIDISDSQITAAFGTVTIDAGDSLNVCSSDISGYEVSMESTGPLTISDDTTVSSSDTVSLASDFSDLDIYCSTITAGGDTVTLNAPNGEVDMMGDYVNVESGGDSSDSDISISDDSSIDSDGAVCITANGGTVNINGDYIAICGTQFNFGGNICISGSEIAAGDGDVDITAAGTLNINATDSIYLNDNEVTGGNITIANVSSITADYGNVNIENGFSGTEGLSIGGGNINICDSSVAADDEDTSGFGNITVSTPGNISITGDTTLSGSENVCIDAGGDEVDSGVVTLASEGSDSGYGDITICSSSISAGLDNSVGGSAYINAGGNVSIQDGTAISAYNDVDINAGEAFRVSVIDVGPAAGGVDIEDSTIQAGYFIGSSGLDFTAAGGDVNINAYGESVCLNNDLISAATGTSGPSQSGNINVYANDNINVYETGLDAGIGGSVSLTGENGCVDVYDSNSGDEVLPDLTMNDWTISAGEGVSISADQSVTIDGGTITANDGDVDITSQTVVPVDVISPSTYDITIDDSATIDARGTVDVSDNTGDIDINTGVTLTAGTGNIVLDAAGNVDVENSTLTATGGGSDVTLNNTTEDLGGSALTAIGGTIDITAGGDVTLNNDIINLGGNVTLEGGAGVTDSGDVDITAEGTLSIDADGTVSITGGEINGGSISISGGSFVASANGNVDLTAGEDIIISGSTISATPDGTDVFYSGGTDGNPDATPLMITSNGGNIDIVAGNNVNLDGSTFDLGGNIEITDGEDISSDGDVDIDAGQLVVTAGGAVSISGCTVNGGAITIDGSSFIDADGNVNIVGQEVDIDTAELYADEDISISSGDSITINNATLSANQGGIDNDFNNGEVNEVDAPIVASGGNISLSAVNAVSLSSSTFDLGGSINVSGGTVLVASTGDLDLTAGQLGVTAGGPLTVSGCTVNGGQISVTGGSGLYSTEGNVNLTAEGVTIDTGSVVYADNDVKISASDTVAVQNAAGFTSGNNITIDAANVTQQTTAIEVNDTTLVASSGTVTLDNTGTTGNVNIENGSTVETANLVVNSGDGILIDGLGNGSSGNSATITTSLGTAADDVSGAHTVSISGSDLTGFAEMNVQGHTVNLTGDNFSSSGDYNFTSFYHEFYVNPNSNVAGAVNFNGDMLNGNNITGSSGANPTDNTGGIVLGGTGAGIHVN